MPITEEVLDELVGEKKETPTHGGGAKDKETAKEGKHEKGHVAKNIMEASKASKEKVIKAAGKAKMNIRKRIDSERDPERQNSRGQLIKGRYLYDVKKILDLRPPPSPLTPLSIFPNDFH